MDIAVPASFFSDFHFLRPLWLLGLIPILVFFLALWRVNSAMTAWDKAIDKDLLPYLLDRSKNAAQRTPLIMLFVAWTLSLLALSGPVWEQLPQPVQKREDAVVIVLDLSLSMFANDHTPSRIDLAKRKLRDVLALRDEGQTGLVVYAGDAHTVTPLTDDTITISALVPSLNPNIMPLLGSEPVSALRLAVGLLDDVQATRGRILFMTDGISGFDEEQRITELLNETDYELLIMGIGTEQGAPIRTNDGDFLRDETGQPVVPTLNRNLLETLANRTNGRYHDIQLSDADLAYLLSDLSLLDDENLSDVEDEEFDVWYEAGPWFLLLVLPLVAMSFRRGWLFSFVFLSTVGVFAPTQQAQAADWASFWSTKDQQGAAAFNAEDHETAMQLFEAPEWRGASAYRAADYESAIAAYSGVQGATAQYNRGNALALSGNYAESIAAYDAALALEPEHADALHNKAIVEQLLEQEESEAGEEQDGESQDQESQENSESESEQQEEQNDQQDQESQEGNQEQEQQEQQQNAPPEEQEGSESNSEQNTPSETTNEEFEEQQALEQWLRRIEDDPGELLRRKFRYQYRQRQLDGTANNLRAGGQIW